LRIQNHLLHSIVPTFGPQQPGGFRKTHAQKYPVHPDWLGTDKIDKDIYNKQTKTTCEPLNPVTGDQLIYDAMICNEQSERIIIHNLYVTQMYHIVKPPKPRESLATHPVFLAASSFQTPMHIFANFEPSEPFTQTTSWKFLEAFFQFFSYFFHQILLKNVQTSPPEKSSKAQKIQRLHHALHAPLQPNQAPPVPFAQVHGLGL